LHYIPDLLKYGLYKTADDRPEQFFLVFKVEVYGAPGETDPLAHIFEPRGCITTVCKLFESRVKDVRQTLLAAPFAQRS
jgi:hypothetical protein